MSTSLHFSQTPLNPEVNDSASSSGAESMMKSQETDLAPGGRRGDWTEVIVVVVEDSPLNRNILIRSFKKVEATIGGADWTFSQFETVEQAQPYIRLIHEACGRVIICLDENMGSRGGVLTGTQCTRWLLNELNFRGIIISTSGDPDAGRSHLALGAHCAWSKPYPLVVTMLEDLRAAAKACGWHSSVEERRC
mmetsp:Transcript_9300/g.23668  ORF Transcript_9300/g.23668 Transcript_9300/m.23668 type:complete len:193 (-) Transcript_9300:241-819(-)